MALAHPFRGFRFPPEVILWTVRWYLRYAVSFRDLEETLADRGVRVDHVSLHRWVQRFAPEIGRRVRPHLRASGRTWHVDETYIRVGGGWRYLNRAVDGAGRTVGFLLSAARDAAAARRFFSRALGRGRARAPRAVVTDRLASYRTALARLKHDGRLPAFVRHRRGRWLNNRIEQDHRRVKRRTRPVLGFKRFAAARRALAGIEAVAMLAKGTGARRASGGRPGAAHLRPPAVRRRRPTASARRPRHARPRPAQQSRPKRQIWTKRRLPWVSALGGVPEVDGQP